MILVFPLHQCSEYYDLTLQQEQKNFNRVQLVIVFSCSCWKLQAISSPMSDFVHAVHNRYSTLSFIMDNECVKSFQLIAQPLHMIETNFIPLLSQFLNTWEGREVPEGFIIFVEYVFTIIEEMLKYFYLSSPYKIKIRFME